MSDIICTCGYDYQKTCRDDCEKCHYGVRPSQKSDDLGFNDDDMQYGMFDLFGWAKHVV